MILIQNNEEKSSFIISDEVDEVNEGEWAIRADSTLVTADDTTITADYDH